MNKNKFFKRRNLLFWALATLFFFTTTAPLYSRDDKIITVYGEYPVIEEIGGGRFEGSENREIERLIKYERGKDFRDKALIEALHFLNANIFGYTFSYKPASALMKTEEVFEIELKGEIEGELVTPVGEGVRDSIYRVKIGFPVTPSLERWLSAFNTSNIRLADAEGTSDFYSGWEARSDAYREALRNLVLVSARRRISSKPLSLKGDILLKGNPTFSVGAGRYYCKVEGYVNFLEIVTYD